METKNNNEITVKVNTSINEMEEILKSKGFKLSDKFLKNNLKIDKISRRI